MRWEKWLDPTAKFTMVPETNYCDVIVPTVNTVRMAHLLELLLINCNKGLTFTPQTLRQMHQFLNPLPPRMVAQYYPSLPVSFHCISYLSCWVPSMLRDLLT